MTVQTQFWLATGFMAGIAAAFFMLRLWQAQAMRVLNGWTAGALLVFSVGSVWIYSKVGTPEAAQSAASAPAWPQVMSGGVIPTRSTEANQLADSQAGSRAGSMDEAIQRLSAKLARGQGNDADWQLLAQSYRFVGNEALATLADQHQLPAASASAAPTATVSVGMSAAPSATRNGLQALQQRVKLNPRDVAGWRALAEALRTNRQFDQSLDAYAELIKLKGMDADAWADYADAAGSKTGSLVNTQTRDALSRALQLDARHPKALWLLASLQLEDKQYAQSLKTWQQLRAVIPDASPDARIIDANINEARALAGKRGSVVAASNQASTAVAGDARITGQINADASIAAKGKTLFVFAKAADSPAPVAVWRMTVDRWPVTFTLDDASAMMPARKLSMYSQVQIQARLSQSGQAMSQPGDWQSEAQTVSTRQGKAISLVINRPVT